MATILSTFTEVMLADTRRRAGTVLLPPLSAIPYRMLTFKDVYGTFSNSTLTISTQGGNTFEDSTTSIVLSNAFSFYNLYAASTSWLVLDGTQTLVQSISTLNVNSINVGNGVGWLQFGPIQTVAVSTSQIFTDGINANGISTFNMSVGQLNVSSITGLSLVYTSNLVSTTLGLQTYVSTFIDPNELASTVANLISSTYFASQLASTVAGLGTAGYVSSAALSGLVSTPNLLNLVSTANLSGLVSTANLLNLVSTPNLQNLVSTANLQNLLSTANLSGLISTGNLLNLVSTPNLQNLVSTANLSGLVSTGNLLNLVSTANLSGLVSTGNLLNLVSTTYLASQLASTVAGLGQAGYLSSVSFPGVVSTPNLQNLVSTPNLLNLVSTANLSGLISTLNLIGLVSTPNLLNLVSTANLSGLVSTPNLVNLVSTSYFESQLASTVVGLSNVAVTQLIAGSNVFISPISGIGAVTIDAAANGVIDTQIASTLKLSPVFSNVAVGYFAGNIGQSNGAVAIGQYAATLGQAPYSIAIGDSAASSAQDSNAIAIGYQAGQFYQEQGAISMGYGAGVNRQSSFAVAIGWTAGSNGQGSNGIAIGNAAGNSNQGFKAVAIGYVSGTGNQGINSVAIGPEAGRINQGEYSVAIGPFAGQTSQISSSIVLNARATALDAAASGFFVAPVRYIQGSQTNAIAFNSNTNEIGYVDLGGGGSTSIPAYLSTINISTKNITVSSVSMIDATGFFTDLNYFANETGITISRAKIGLASGDLNGNSQVIFAKSLSIANGSFTGLSQYNYLLEGGASLTGTVSTLTFTNGVTGNVTALYLSSLYLGNTGGTTLGELTTDSTATNIYWKGTQLNGGGGGGITTSNLVSTTSGLQTNFIGQQGYFSTLFINMTSATAPAWSSSNPIAGSDPEPNPLAFDMYGSARILKNLYIGSTTTILGTAGIYAQTVSTNTTTAKQMNFSSLFVNNAPIIVDSNGNIIATTQVF